MGKITIGLVALIVTLISIVVASLVVQYYHPETVTVISLNLEEYLDGELLANETTLDWGEVSPGTYNWSYTVKNAGSIECKVYRFVYDLPVGWGYSWDWNGTTLAPSQAVDGNLTLTIPSGAEGAFSWYSYLVGEQT